MKKWNPKIKIESDTPDSDFPEWNFSIEEFKEKKKNIRIAEPPIKKKKDGRGKKPNTNLF